jgi:phage gp46-like protein
MTQQDVLIRPNQFGIYDLQFDGPDFQSAEGFETAIPVSLFTDARAPANAVQDPLRRRGWVGNLLGDIDRELGSLLWLFEQSRLTAATLNDLRAAATNALRWLIEDGAAREVDVTVDQPTSRGVRIFIRITGLDNDVNQFSVLWRRTNAANMAVVQD